MLNKNTICYFVLSCHGPFSLLLNSVDLADVFAQKWRPRCVPSLEHPRRLQSVSVTHASRQVVSTNYLT